MPEFAERVRALFDAHRHKTIATLRADGAPRISGIESVFDDGQLVFGSMPKVRKGAELLRDPRFALHSATVDPVAVPRGGLAGEAKIYRARDPRRPHHGLDPTVTASSPTSPRWCTPTSTTPLGCWFAGVAQLDADRLGR